eukprot:gnl/Chilomastix_cuspidata/4295.p1 GENE.gnl/Chilomastix_cuspidata/4295~~gnl/Chilomastix_cuspidata/4295.p1  ORF type:complete len:287 (+),score=79.17 gnl/Chilomastix_cuspidata/4295:217-1077(+)
MKIAVTSDWHFPWEMTKITTFTSRGYNKSFYTSKLGKELQRVGNAKVDAFVFAGDFFWDPSKLGMNLIVSYKLLPMIVETLSKTMRELPKRTPKLFIPGNHDWWLRERVLETRGDAGEVFFCPHVFSRLAFALGVPEAEKHALCRDTFDFFKVPHGGPLPAAIRVPALCGMALSLRTEHEFLVRGQGENALVVGAETMERTAELALAQTAADHGAKWTKLVAVCHIPNFYRIRNITNHLSAHLKRSKKEMSRFVFGHVHFHSPVRMRAVESALVEDHKMSINIVTF